MTQPRLNRRNFLSAGAWGATVLSLPACGYYSAEQGDAYAPWDFDQTGTPQLVAVRAAILAASPHNTQPWRFETTADRIDLFAEPSRELGAMDPLGREQHIGLGCALENMVLAVQDRGLRARVEVMQAQPVPYIASVWLEQGEPAADPLFHAIPHRHTNRGSYIEGGPPAGLDAALREHTSDSRVRLTMLSSPSDKASFRQGTIAATEAIVSDAEMNEASHLWYRHSKEDIQTHRDGLTLDATGNGASLRFFGKIAGRPSAETAGNYWLKATRGPQTTGCAFVLLSTADSDTMQDRLQVGRTFQRMHLFATQEGLALQPLNQMAERQDREQALGLEPVFTQWLDQWLPAGHRAQMLFRIGFAWDEAKQSPRRPVEWVMS